MLQRAERCARGVFAKTPARHHVGAARQAGFTAVAVPDRNVRAPTATYVFIVLILIARAEGCGVRQVKLKIGQRGSRTVGLMIAERVGIFLCHDQARAQAAILRQRHVEVRAQAPFVPTAIGGVGTAAEFETRAFADQVNGGRRVARAAQQAIGAANDVDTFVHVHVQRVAGAAEVRAARELQAVGFPVGNRITACPVLGAPAHFRLAHGDAGCAVQRLLDIGDLAVGHLFLGDGGDRLWRLARGEFHARRTGGALDGVTQLAAAFIGGGLGALNIQSVEFQRRGASLLAGHAEHCTEAHGDHDCDRAAGS